jgi:hypothetical protein
MEVGSGVTTKLDEPLLANSCGDWVVSPAKAPVNG